MVDLRMKTRTLLFMGNRIFPFFLSILFCAPLRSNPLPPPPLEFLISELLFESEGKWVMELRLRNAEYHSPEELESVYIKSSNSRVKWDGLLTRGDGSDFYFEVVLLRNDSLDSDLIINPEGDFLQVVTYWGWETDSICHTLVFGNYPDAVVRSPDDGESIVFAEEYYCIDASPTIGFPNDEEGITGMVTFDIYYPDRQPFVFSDVRLFDADHLQFIPIYKNEDGSYSGELYRGRYLIDKLYVGSKYGYYTEYWEFKNPINCRMDEAMRWSFKIRLRIDLDRFTGMQTVETEGTLLKIFPNPIMENTFGYETTLPVRSAKSVIEITGLNGQIVAQYPIFENKGKMTLPANTAKGIYNAALTVNKKKYATTKIIVQ
jgi:hypothetical protein